MENKIISINISPGNDEEINENAGVMWEHNATSLVFSIDPSYVGDYRYYIEYRSLMGTKVRTEYLELNGENNTVTYDIPVTMTSLRGVECFFNIVKIDEDGQTVQVIKPKKFCLQFDYSPDTDNSLAKVNDFSINALLEAIRTGAFKGEPGDPIADVDGSLSETSKNPVQNKVIYSTFNALIADFEKAIEATKSSLESAMVKYANNNFVAKEDGKGLSANDFTDEYKGKLDNVDENPATQISDIDESTESGGSSVITFNDGNTLTIKNGINGSMGVDGYTPVKGVDYWTDSDKTEMQDDCNVYIAEQLADRTQLTPEFANDISECTDTTKLYVLPDNFIYTYLYTESEPPEIKYEYKSDGFWQYIADRGGIIEQTVEGTYGVRTNTIPVQPGDVLNYVSGNNDEYVPGVVWYDESETALSIENGTGEYTVPDGVAYAQFYSYGYKEAEAELVIEWLKCQAVVVGYQWKNTGHAFVPADYEDIILDHEKRIDDIEANSNPLLKDKIIVYDGDSICENRDNNGGGYAKLIQDLTGCIAVNKGVSGARLTSGTHGKHSIVDNLENIKNNYPNADLYCFEGGVNDVWDSVSLGTYSMSDYTGDVDKTTICGALETIFRYALDNFAGKPICFVISHKVSDINYENYKNYHDSVVAICNKYSIPYYDAYNESGLNGWNTAQSNAFLTGNATNTPDGCHPNEEGYKRYYVPQLISLFEKIMPR